MGQDGNEKEDEYAEGDSEERYEIEESIANIVNNLKEPKCDQAKFKDFLEKLGTCKGSRNNKVVEFGESKVDVSEVYSHTG